MTAAVDAILEGTELLGVAGALDADLVLVAGGGTYARATEDIVAEGETYGAGGTQYTGTYDPLAGATGDEPEDVLAAAIGLIDGLSGVTIREIALLHNDDFPAITIEREKTDGQPFGEFDPCYLIVRFWAKEGADARALAKLVPRKFDVAGLTFEQADRKSDVGLPKPSRDEHACFVACTYLVKN